MNRKRSGGLVRAVGALPPISSRGAASANNIAYGGPVHALIATTTARDRLGVSARHRESVQKAESAFVVPPLNGWPGPRGGRGKRAFIFRPPSSWGWSAGASP